MSRDPNGTYTLPPGTIVNTGDTVLPSQHNPAMNDLAASMTNSLARDGQGGMRANLNMSGYKLTNVGSGTLPTDVANVAQATANAVPVGTILDYAGTAPPTGYIICDGRSINRTTYADLFAAIGTTWGTASSSTFNVPDLRGRVTAGVDAANGPLSYFGTVARTLAGLLGAASHVLTIAQMPSHDHTGTTNSTGAHTHDIPSSRTSGGGNDKASISNGTLTTPLTTASDGTHSHTLNINNTGGGGAHPNAPPTAMVYKIIKAQVI